jgi:acyl-CoA ligase (AMP-forming) (exosortase A-associated)
MKDTILLSEILKSSSDQFSDSCALKSGNASYSYGYLSTSSEQFSFGLMELGLERGDRLAIYLEKRVEFVVASFGAVAAGMVFVPVNPLLKPEQVGFILKDCNVRVLVTTLERREYLTDVLAGCKDLQHLVIIEDRKKCETVEIYSMVQSPRSYSVWFWTDFLQAPQRSGHRVIDIDMASILYTSGSTGTPKGVVLSHRNMVAGAKSVAAYLVNTHEDTLLAALPLSFDAGFSQLTTGFHVGARVVLLNYLLPRDVLHVMALEGVTGLTAVPPLYVQLSQLQWPEMIDTHLRYFANTGGRMPLQILSAIRHKVPRARPYLMYGLTEAFRSTYLPPEEIDRRPNSIGKAIPNAEILVVREDGSLCESNEPGELVHRGALVAMGYWNDAEKTAERFKVLPLEIRRPTQGLQLPEYAVFSGDTVTQDSEGFLYFVGRRDEMIKTSGYRVSPSEVEEVIYATRMVGECAAFGVEHPVLGQVIRVMATRALASPKACSMELVAVCRSKMPVYMVPAGIDYVDEPLPRNPNGKIDRKLLTANWHRLNSASINQHK